MCLRPSFQREGYLQLIVRISFFKHCISEIRKISNLTRILQGPDGVCSQQTIRDLEVTLSTLRHIVGSIKNISPEYVSKLDMALLTTLVVENLFAEMRDGNDMPLVLQFANRLLSTRREHLKRNTKCSFNYFTSSSAFYSKKLGFPTILYNSNHAQTRERFQGDQATIDGNAKVARRIRPKCSPGHRT